MSKGIVKTKAGFQKTDDALCGNGSQLNDVRKKQAKYEARQRFLKEQKQIMSLSQNNVPEQKASPYRSLGRINKLLGKNYSSQKEIS